MVNKNVDKYPLKKTNKKHSFQNKKYFKKVVDFRKLK